MKYQGLKAEEDEYQQKKFFVMSETTKTFVFPENGIGGNSTEGMLIGSMMNGGMNGGGMWNNPIGAIVFLAALRNGGIFGNNGDYSHPCTTSQLSAIQETLNSNHGQTLLMDAIKGNGNSIHELATTLNCNQNAVISAINSVQGAICNLGNSVGMNSMQIVNAINSGNASLANQLSQCCCDVKQLVTTQGYENRLNNERQSQLIQNGFSQVGYASAEQTCAIKQNNTDNTNRVIAKLDQIEDSRKDREISSLTAALTAANLRAERQAELAPIYKALGDIQCKQPNTVTVPYQPFVTVPNCVAWNAGYGLNPYAQGGSIWS